MNYFLPHSTNLGMTYHKIVSQKMKSLKRSAHLVERIFEMGWFAYHVFNLVLIVISRKKRKKNDNNIQFYQNI